jgi:general stress protein 26
MLILGLVPPMSAEGVIDFLTNSKLNLLLSTIDQKGDPNIHPVWFFFDSSMNSFYIGTGRQSKKVANLRNHDTVYFCVDEPKPPYKGVRGKGKVTVHSDTDHNVRIEEKILVKYMGGLESEGARMLMGMTKSGDAVIVEIFSNLFFNMGL